MVLGVKNNRLSQRHTPPDSLLSLHHLGLARELAHQALISYNERLDCVVQQMPLTGSPWIARHPSRAT
jgi:hypothetical protein